MWRWRVLSFASPIKCRTSVVFSYVLFRCVLVTFVGGSIFFRVRIFSCYEEAAKRLVLMVTCNE